MRKVAHYPWWMQVLGWAWFAVFTLIGLDAMTGGIITTGGRGGPHTFYGTSAVLVGLAFFVFACGPVLFRLQVASRMKSRIALIGVLFVLVLFGLARHI